MAKSLEDLKNYREALIAERESLGTDISNLENINYEILKQLKELEIKMLEKNRASRELSATLHEVKRNLVRFVTEESSLATEIDLIETEKGRMIAAYNEMSRECSDNISNLGSTILKIDFIKGELESLTSKIRMTEEKAGEEFRELDSLEDKFSWASKAFAELYDSMKGIEKGLKIKYYTKEQPWNKTTDI